MEKKKEEVLIKDSYKEFFQHFHITANNLFEWGIENVVWVEPKIAAIEWKKLKEKIEGIYAGEIHIRGYGRDSKNTPLFTDLYQKIFPNIKIEKDTNNNNFPTKMLENLTHYKKNESIFNYQVSHIWGHTKNPFLFECPWNVCFMPKILDPFSGHESTSTDKVIFQERLKNKAVQMYSDLIEDYQRLKKDIEKRIECILDEYINTQQNYQAKTLRKFEKDLHNEWADLDFIKLCKK